MDAVKHTAKDTDTLARTMYGEAERGDREDLVAIAWTVRNRATDQAKRWPRTISAVCLQALQFSCWNDATNAKRLRAVSAEVSPWFRECLAVAEAVLHGERTDPTDGANHYFATYIKIPVWARKAKPTHHTPNGDFNHYFYRL